MFLENKNLIVDENRRIKFASNGHGNVFEAMKKNGVISELKKRKIKYLLIKLYRITANFAINIPLTLWRKYCKKSPRLLKSG